MKTRPLAAPARRFAVTAGLCGTALATLACTEEELAQLADSGVDASFDATALPDGAPVRDGGGDSTVPTGDASPDAHADAHADGGIDAEALWCGDPSPDGGPDGAVDGGPLCAKGQWRDFFASTCKACPATAVTCSDFQPPVATTTPIRYSYVQQYLAFELPPGRAQIMGGTAEVTLSSCYSNSAHSTITATTYPVRAEGDLLYVDFNGDVNGSKSPCGVVTLTLRDACCGQSSLFVEVFTDSESYAVTSSRCPIPVDGGILGFGDGGEGGVSGPQ